MASKRRAATDSSSGSSSNSSSNSSSDSGSSSDDSDSSSSSGSGSASNNEKETKVPQKVVRRKSSESVPVKSKPEEKIVQQPPVVKRVVSSSTAKVMQQKLAKASARGEKRGPNSWVGSHSDDSSDSESDSRMAQKQSSQDVSKKGGKAPPAVLKQHHATGPKGAHNSSTANNRAKGGGHSSGGGNASDNTQKKQKSIFSPENSSDSDDDDPPKAPVHKGGAKIKNVSKTVTTKSNVDEKTSAPQKVVTHKSSSSSSADDDDDSSSSNGDGSSDDDSSDSDSGTSSEDSSPPAKKPATKKAVNNKTPTKLDSKRDSEMSEDEVKNPVRKLTRSSSTRKSKHLTGKGSNSDSEDDAMKRSDSKSPVKKAKGKTKNSNSTVRRNDSKNSSNHISQLTQQQQPPVVTRRCPNEKCNSMGHLNGSFEKHFTIEACPMFHNVTLAETKTQQVDRRKREEERQRAMMALDANKNVTTEQQKNYLQKIRDLRAKFKPTPNVNGISGAGGQLRDAEPNLAGCMSEYDLNMFRDAQALAAEKIETELKKFPPTRGTKFIQCGKYKMEVWYQSPYSEDVARLPKLFICEFCLRYQKSEVGMKRHAAKCVWRHPPGDEIYRKSKLSVWQVDGKRHKQYCQHLCLLAKFFLDYKTLWTEVEPFLFYVMTLADNEGCHTVGYFSKEKNSVLNYNVSCILTLPPYQRKGYGRLLIDFSYLLTRVEGKIGSPEKPLSDLGLISYRSYWKDVLLDYLCTRTGTHLNIKDLSQEMAIYSYDIVSTLQALGMMKYWKGKHIILKKQDVLDEYKERVKRRGTVLKIDPTCLRWVPFTVPSASGSSS